MDSTQLHFHQQVGHAVMRNLSKSEVGEQVPLDMLYQQMVQEGTQPYSNHEELLAFLRKYPFAFQLHDIPPVGIYVKAKSSIGICEQFWNKGLGCQDSGCKMLHICKFFLLTGNCKFMHECYHSHSFETSHNTPILQANFLSGINDGIVRNLVMCRQREKIVPLICKFYNVEGGCRNGKEGNRCPALHICKYYMKKDCSFGQLCRRSHNIFDGQPKAILAKYGFDVEQKSDEVLDELREKMGDMTIKDSPYKNVIALTKIPGSTNPTKPPSTIQTTGPPSIIMPTGLSSVVTPPSNIAPAEPSSIVTPTGSISNLSPHQKIRTCEESPEICSLYLKGDNLNRNSCKFGDLCTKVHCYQPFQWLYFNKSKNLWVRFEDDLNGNLGIEHAFSDPCALQCFAFDPDSGRNMEIDFSNENRIFGMMKKGEEIEIQRISAPPSGKNDTHRFPTEWVWYFWNKEQEWQEYKYGVTSEKLEKMFQENPEKKFEITTPVYTYMIDFSKMKQKNIKTETERAIRRRPRYRTINTMVKRTIAATQTTERNVYPYNRSMSGLAKNTDYNLVTLNDSNEKAKISQLFAETMPKSQLKSVKRIQNPDLWEDFSRMKKKMEKNSGKGYVEEKLLFHGTDEQYIDAICKRGFDWRIAGKSDSTRFGKGSYFATDAAYSDKFNHNCRKLFVVRVLVGNYAVGKPDDVRPAPIDSSNPLGGLYDSSVNDAANPKIFVIFDTQQAYPEYLIEYSKTYVRRHVGWDAGLP